MPMTYTDGAEVELFDHVEVTFPDRTYREAVAGRTVTARFEGQITKLHPLKGTVRVGYADHWQPTRAGEPTWRSAEVPVAQVQLVRRDG